MKLIIKIRLIILFFIVAIIISGVTAFPIQTELHWLLQFKNSMPLALGNWLQSCYQAIVDTNTKYPMIAYGFDWLAFAHIVIATAFIGPLKDPVKNIWIIDWAMIACVLVWPLAIIAGPIRSIPPFHIVIDCCFGIFGLIPLFICRRWIKQLEKQARQMTG
jgi:membrane protease YdiL (CAAX protease family)